MKIRKTIRNIDPFPKNINPKDSDELNFMIELGKLLPTKEFELNSFEKNLILLRKSTGLNITVLRKKLKSVYQELGFIVEISNVIYDPKKNLDMDKKPAKNDS